jgi:hypothetical protein
LQATAVCLPKLKKLFQKWEFSFYLSTQVSKLFIKTLQLLNTMDLTGLNGIKTIRLSRIQGSATEKGAKFWNAAEQFLNISPRNMYYFFKMFLR